MTEYKCPGCGYIYDEAKGAPHEGYPGGTRWDTLPNDWPCPVCAVREKPDFVKMDAGKTNS